MFCGAEGDVVCQMCAYDMFQPVPSRCYNCLKLTRDSRVGEKCRKTIPVRQVRVVTDYDKQAKKFIGLLKFERARSVADLVAQQIAQSLPQLPPETVITHLPTATTRHRARGYDQSQLIAKKLSKITKLPYMQLLERRGQTRQVGATRSVRIKQAKNMFVALGPENIAGKTVLIVDDILTTGASLSAAAGVLKQNGAKNVSAAVFAQKH